MELRFKCSHCDALVTALPAQIGQTISCPNCQGSVIVPDPAIENQPRAVPPTATASKTKWSTRKKVIVFSSLGCTGSLVALVALLVLLAIIGNANQGSNSTTTQGSSKTEVSAMLSAVNSLVDRIGSQVSSGVSPSAALEQPMNAIHALQFSTDFPKYPPDVQAAYLQFVSAMEELKREADAQPKSVEEGMLRGLANTMNGEQDGGQGRANRAMLTRLNTAQEAQVNLNKVAQKYLD